METKQLARNGLDAELVAERAAFIDTQRRKAVADAIDRALPHLCPHIASLRNAMAGVDRLRNTTSLTR